MVVGYYLSEAFQLYVLNLSPRLVMFTRLNAVYPFLNSSQLGFQNWSGMEVNTSTVELICCLTHWLIFLHTAYAGFCLGVHRTCSQIISRQTIDHLFLIRSELP